MTDPAPAPAGQIRALCDRIHDIDYQTEPAPAAPSMDGGGSADRLMINPRMLKAKENLKATLVSWALMISEELKQDYDGDDNVLSVTAWVRGHADYLGRHPAAEDFITEVDTCLAGIIRCMEKGDKRVFVGTFNGQDIYAHRDDATVTLPNGDTHLVETMRNELKDRALWARGTAAQVAEILGVLHGVNVSAKAIIAMWREDKKAREKGRLGRLEGLECVDANPPTFVVDEVLARVARQSRAQKVS